ncbi:MAG: hypothetical protein WC662_00010 [Candidatus Paceibacterota bacterium]|jgi:hypothetical protein
MKKLIIIGDVWDGIFEAIKEANEDPRKTERVRLLKEIEFVENRKATDDERKKIEMKVAKIKDHIFYKLIKVEESKRLGLFVGKRNRVIVLSLQTAIHILNCQKSHLFSSFFSRLKRKYNGRMQVYIFSEKPYLDLLIEGYPPSNMQGQYFLKPPKEAEGSLIKKIIKGLSLSILRS